MPTNQFLPVATGGGANVLSQSAYAALTSLLANGWSSGVVDSPTFNKMFRQATFVAAAIAQTIVDNVGIDAPDDGDLATFENNFLHGMRRFNISGTYGADSGSAANIYQFAYSPTVPSTQASAIFRILAAHTNTGASTFTPNPGTITAKPIYDTNHLPLNGGEIVAGGEVWLQWNAALNGGSGAWVLIVSTGRVLPTPIGQCQLSLNAGNIVLSPYNGNQIVINGTVQRIPSAGVSLAATGLTATTLYYIYARMSSGTMVLEASTTGHSTDATTGVEIKTGDATRTLVGMVRPIAGPAFQDAANQRFVRSWFNRQSFDGHRNLQASRSTSSTSSVETNSNDRCEFLSWADESIDITIQGLGSNNTLNASNNVAIGIDGSTAGTQGIASNQYVASYGITYNTRCILSSQGEGYHYASTFFFTTAGATYTLVTSSATIVKLSA